MKTQFSNFCRHYEAALHSSLQDGGNLDAVPEINHLARSSGIPIREFAAFHEQILLDGVRTSITRGRRLKQRRRASAFFAEVCGFTEGDEAGKPSALKQTIAILSERGTQLADDSRDLRQKLAKSLGREKDRKSNHLRFTHSLKESERLKDQLRLLSRRILTVQEDERKKISRELHDVIAQSLVGVNFRLAALKRESSLNTRALHRNITLTQSLVKKSTEIVHRFARELRPTVLDDIGLVPALHAYMKGFTTRTGVRSHLTSSSTVDRLDAKQRTVLYRVAQEALTNVGNHAKASRVDVTISTTPTGVALAVKDDGKSFSPERILRSKRLGRLGIVGMRERIEMVGGTFKIDSSPGHGTLITAEIPCKRTPPKRPATKTK
jgi:signal transduction histidine kinase